MDRFSEAALLSCVSFFLYARDVLAGSARPNVVSLTLWTAFEAVALAAQLSTGVTLSAVFLAALVLGTGGIAVLGLCGWGYAAYGRLDAVCAALWAAGLTLAGTRPATLLAVAYPLWILCLNAAVAAIIAARRPGRGRRAA